MHAGAQVFALLAPSCRDPICIFYTNWAWAHGHGAWISTHLSNHYFCIGHGPFSHTFEHRVLGRMTPDDKLSVKVFCNINKNINLSKCHYYYSTKKFHWKFLNELWWGIQYWYNLLMSTSLNLLTSCWSKIWYTQIEIKNPMSWNHLNLRYIKQCWNNNRYYAIIRIIIHIIIRQDHRRNFFLRWVYKNAIYLSQKENNNN
jgi:hypothetical protein